MGRISEAKAARDAALQAHRQLLAERDTAATESARLAGSKNADDQARSLALREALRLHDRGIEKSETEIDRLTEKVREAVELRGSVAAELENMRRDYGRFIPFSDRLAESARVLTPLGRDMGSVLMVDHDQAWRRWVQFAHRVTAAPGEIERLERQLALFDDD